MSSLRAYFQCDWMGAGAAGHQEDYFRLPVPNWARVTKVDLPLFRWDKTGRNTWSLEMEQGSLVHDLIVRGMRGGFALGGLYRPSILLSSPSSPQSMVEGDAGEGTGLFVSLSSRLANNLPAIQNDQLRATLGSLQRSLQALADDARSRATQAWAEGGDAAAATAAAQAAEARLRNLVTVQQVLFDFDYRLKTISASLKPPRAAKGGGRGVVLTQQQRTAAAEEHARMQAAHYAAATAVSATAASAAAAAPALDAMVPSEDLGVSPGRGRRGETRERERGRERDDGRTREKERVVLL